MGLCRARAHGLCRVGNALVIRWLAVAVVLAGGITPAMAAPPLRVVSMNLCTDQLAMQLAAPGQLVSVSRLTADPLSSLMADQAAGYALNDGQAEQVYLMQPDLVIAGTYTARPAVEMLQRLGVRVVSLPPAQSVQDVRAGITQMGDLLGHPAQAARLLAQFDADMAALPGSRGVVATGYAANGYTPGRDSLSGDVMRAAGLDLLADRLGMPAGGQVPLELLVLAAPDLIVTGTRYPAASRAEEVLDHPAFAAIPAKRTPVPDRDWLCGLPQIAHVAERLSR